MSARHRPDGDPDAGIRLRPGDRLPRFTLPRASGSGRVDLRGPPRDNTVLLFTPPGPDAEAAFVRRFADAQPRFRDWDARTLVIAPAGRGETARSDAGPAAPAALEDPDGEARRRLGIDPDLAAVVVADRWGIVYLAAAARRPDDLPSLDDLEEQLKFIATQCPECGVLDLPQEVERWSPP